MDEQLIFFISLVVAFIVSKTPLRYPFQWMETFFHEISHGIAALITFGRIHRLRLKFDGAGSCTTIGGLRVLILISGYLGAVIWGTSIYVAGWALKGAHNTEILNFFVGMLVFVTVFWVRDLKTLVIMFIMGWVFYSPTKYYNTIASLPFLIEFIGIYITLSAITAPLNLFDGKHVGDGAELSDLTLIPEGVWIILWFLFGVGALFYIWQLSTPAPMRLMQDIPYLPII